MSDARSLLRAALAHGLDGPELRIVLCVALHRGGRAQEMAGHASVAIDTMPPMVSMGLRFLTAAVVLCGFGLGGWMNMENFITGYAEPSHLEKLAVSPLNLRKTLIEHIDRA